MTLTEYTPTFIPGEWYLLQIEHNGESYYVACEYQQDGTWFDYANENPLDSESTTLRAYAELPQP